MRRDRGQITIEYFLLLAAIVLVTVVGVATFHTDIATTFQNLFSSAVQHMPMDDGGPASPDTGGVPTGPDNSPPDRVDEPLVN